LAEIDTVSGAGGGCARPGYVVVYLPNSREAVRLSNAVPLYYCRYAGASDPQAPRPLAINAFRAGG